MSGTSLDGVDAALVETDGKNYHKFINFTYLPYTEKLKQGLGKAARVDIPLNNLLRLEQELTMKHGEAVNLLLKKAQIPSTQVDIVGFHGQTIRHLPDEGITLQIGNASLLAELTKIPVVADFRKRDMALGGQGAPLVPLFHQALFVNQEKPLVVLNIGGVANITYIGEDDEIIAGDTGPGMGLLDSFISQNTLDSFDIDGKYALKGKIDKHLIKKIIKQPFFKQPLPRSADRYDFDNIDVSRFSIEDAAANLCAITADGVYNALKMLPSMPKTLWVTGGGSNHPLVIQLLRDKLKPQWVKNVEEIGLRYDSMEAECFAWLAVRRLQNLPSSTNKTTGCIEPSCGGVLTT